MSTRCRSGRSGCGQVPHELPLASDEPGRRQHIRQFRPGVDPRDPTAGTQLEFELTNACVVRLRGSVDPSLLHRRDHRGLGARRLPPAESQLMFSSTPRRRARRPLHQAPGHEKTLRRSRGHGARVPGQDIPSRDICFFFSIGVAIASRSSSGSLMAWSSALKRLEAGTFQKLGPASRVRSQHGASRPRAHPRDGPGSRLTSLPAST